MPLTPGTRLGPYEILSPIGEGGMGEVWKARDTRLDRLVAIKQLKGEHGARFQQEARAIATLNHSHICQIYDIGPDYLVLEYVEGSPVHGPLEVGEAVRLALQIAEALEAAHKRGILHRDLKPANVLVTESGVKLLDFGLAKPLEPADTDATKSVEGSLTGTAGYMSPEQAQGKPLDARSDIFSFGAVLYEMISGRPAFTGESLVDILSAVVRDEPPPLQAPGPLARVVSGCLQKSRTERYPTAAALQAALKQAALAPAATQPSIAVLPFANMSADPEQEYFGDGLAEEVINALTQIPGLKVIARTSAFAFKGKNEDIRRIAQLLGVTHVLEGSVRRAGSRVRVTAQLIQAIDGTHLWSQRFDRDLVDVFAIQDEISAAIAAQLKVRLAKPKNLPKSVAAYEAFLEGRHHSLKFSPASAARAFQCLERALSLDPDYAPVHFGLAEHYWVLITMGAGDPRIFLPKLAAAASRAVELDETMAEAHSLVGLAGLLMDYDWAGAEQHIRRALALNPASPSACFAYGYWYLRSLGRLEEAVAVLDRCLEQDPLSPSVRMIKGLTLNWFRPPEEADLEIQRALDIEPDYALALFGRAFVRLAQGRGEEALATLRKLVHDHPGWSLAIGSLASMHARLGHVEETQSTLAELQQLAGRSYVPPSHFARAYGALGDLDSAFEWAEKGIEQRDVLLLPLKADPGYRPLRNDPRYAALLQKMNLA